VGILGLQYFPDCKDIVHTKLRSKTFNKNVEFLPCHSSEVNLESHEVQVRVKICAAGRIDYLLLDDCNPSLCHIGVGQRIK
jgi:hypothetical protein